MQGEKLLDLLVMIVIAAVGLITAYICFGVLESQAEGRYHEYSVGGAIAGALVSWSFLGGFYRQMRRSSGEYERVVKRNEELQQKLMRGAPKPQGFEIEIDERKNIVLARPEEWEPKGGNIFDLELSKHHMRKDDIFPAQFVSWYVPITKVNSDQEAFFKNQVEAAKAMVGAEAVTHEIVQVGGEQSKVKSLKLIAHFYGEIMVDVPSLTGRTEVVWRVVTEDEYNKGVARVAASPSLEVAESDKDGNPPASEPVEEALPLLPDPPSPAPENDVKYQKVVQMRVITFHEELSTIYYFDFFDNEEDFIESSIKFNLLLDSVRFLT
ncbi:MAG: hypothetical protein IIA45_08370 [Bacteroidetes bacterium]|nr:hypothetical protein [Bacteroidota bacterium]